MMRRVLRIFPLYYLFIAVFFLVLPVLFPWHTELQKLPPLQAWYWLYIPNVRIFLQGDWYATYAEHTWSLAIEEQFYLVWPLVVMLVAPKRLIWVAGIGTLFSLAFRVWLATHGGDYAKTLVLTPAHLDGVMLGSMLAVLIEQQPDEPQKLRRLFLAAIGVGLVGLAATAVAPLNYATKHFAFTVTWASLLFAAATGSSGCAKKSTPPFPTTCAASFGSFVSFVSVTPGFTPNGIMPLRISNPGMKSLPS